MPENLDHGKTISCTVTSSHFSSWQQKFFFPEMGSHDLAQAGLMGSSASPASAFQRAVTTAVHHCVWL